MMEALNIETPDGELKKELNRTPLISTAESRIKPANSRLPSLCSVFTLSRKNARKMEMNSVVIETITRKLSVSIHNLFSVNLLILGFRFSDF
jgi:hypothetical protein